MPSRRRRRRRRLRRSGGLVAASLAILLVLAGCATPASDALTGASRPDIATSVELVEVPFHAQTAYHCGPAALAAALRASGDAAPADKLADELADHAFTPGRQGSLQTDMVTATRRQGRLPLIVGSMEAAFRAVDSGSPVVILQNLALPVAPQWHYALLVGYDLDRREAILRSGTTRRLVLPLATLEHTWGRSGFWGIVVADPGGPVPPVATVRGWMAEAAGLERAGRRFGAARAYRTAVERWPDEPLPRVALANALYDSGDLRAAERLLRETVALRPDDPVALNNLAHVLLEQGQLDDAERYAARAVGIGGGSASTAGRTLDEIRERRRATGL